MIGGDTVRDSSVCWAATDKESGVAAVLAEPDAGRHPAARGPGTTGQYRFPPITPPAGPVRWDGSPGPASLVLQATLPHAEPLLPHFDRFEPPRPVWVRNPEHRCWYAGMSFGQVFPAWPNKRRRYVQVEYADDAGQKYQGTVMDLYVMSRHPMPEPEKDAPCAQCGTSRADCHRRAETQCPPYCCPRCRRSRERYVLHARGTGRFVLD